jgi:acyl-CoA thioesterase
MSFSSDTAVSAEFDQYTGHIRPGWDIVGNANGGYLMAIGARAMAAASRPHPVSITAHFLSPGRVGEVWDESGRLVALSRQLALVPRD